MSDRIIPTVGIGASAGGLEALTEFVHAIPNDSGLAYVVVQHLAPDHPSLMDQLLGAHTPVPVKRIEDGDVLAPDRIFIIPPGRFLEIADGRLRLIEHGGEAGVRTPIDRFFASLAEAAGRSAFAVVLSGTGSDGTMGVRAIKTHGGVAIVQESGSARFSGMPDSASATGLVDFALPAKDIPGRILELVHHRERLDDEIGHDALIDEIERRLPEILDRVEDEAGNSFSGYKAGTLVRRVARRMTLRRQSTVEGYLGSLAAEPEERALLAQDFLIGVTEFFRDPSSFESLRREALAPLLDRDQSEFRIWVPGCSTGEEAYSIAMLMTELSEERGDHRSWKIFGTDIDLDALRRARTGHYPGGALKSLSKDRRDRFFLREEADWRVSSALRERCIFAPHNLLQDPPFSRLDLVSCRNLMIYLTPDSQDALMPRFHYGLNPGGFLWLGPSESLGRNEKYFRTVERNARIFRRDDSAAPGFSAAAQRQPRASELKRLGGAAPAAAEPGARPRGDIEALSEQGYLRARAAPFATVDQRDEVLYISEAMTAFVRPSRGAASTAVDDYLAPELRLPVQNALSERRETGAEAEVRDVVVTVDGTPRLFDVTAAPLGADGDLTLVALVEVRMRDAGDIVQAGGRANDERRDQELLLTRKRLATLQREYQTADQELRSANEELLSMNEELQSSNEELETSREELQSINEELETINAELTENNRQLTRANSDLKNLLESTEIATLFIDQADCVRLFTPAARRLFGVQERDIGRPIEDLARKVEYPELAEDAAEALRTLRVVERELRIPGADETFAATVRPYRTTDNRLDGVVMTFMDVTARKRDERRLAEYARDLAEQYAQLETLYRTAPVGLALQDRDLRYLRINETLASINGVSVADHLGRLQEEVLPETHEKVAPLERRVFETGEAVLGIEVSTETPATPGEVRQFVVDYYPVRSGEEIFAIGCCVREVTEQRRLQSAVAESEARMRRLFDQAPVSIAILEGAEHRFIYSNPRNQAEIGDRETVGRRFVEALPEAEGSPFLERHDRVFATGEPDTETEHEALVPNCTLDGPRSWFRSVIQPWFDADERIAGTMSFNMDVTDMVVAREEAQASRARLQRVQDGLNAFIGLLAPDGTLLDANAPALERGGLAREEAVGRPFWECGWWSWSGDEQRRLREAVARAAKGELVRFEATVRLRDDARAILDVSLSPTFGADGAVAELVGCAIDVTEQAAARRGLVESEARQRLAVDAARLGLFEWRQDEDEARWENDRIYEIFGRDPKQGPLGFAEYAERVLVSDPDALAVEIEAAKRTGRLETRVRIRRESDGALRWIEYFGSWERRADGAFALVGVVADATERVETEERRRVLLAELEHRVKNTLATVQSIARFTARLASSKEEMAQSLTSRLAAIARTHDALVAEEWTGRSLRAMVEAEVAPYAEGRPDRFAFFGRDVRLRPRSAMNVGLALHELATNAAKHGAFSTGTGRVEVTVERGSDGFSRIEWRESGGPPVEKPTREGFGSFLVGTLLKAELDADVTIDYAPKGMRCVIRRRATGSGGDG